MNIDIDDTIVDETGFMMKHAPRYLKKVLGRDFSVANPDRNNNG